MIYWSKVVSSNPDITPGEIYSQQVTYDGIPADCQMIFPFGYHANLTDDSLVLTFEANGYPEDRVGLGWTPLIRPDLKAGEVAIFAPDNPTHTMKLRRESGVEDIQLVAPGTVLSFCNRIQGVAGEIDFNSLSTFTVDASGDITLTPGVSNKVIVEGDVQVNGDIGCTGTITGDVDVIAATISGKTHTHIGSPTAPTGGISPTGVPV